MGIFISILVILVLVIVAVTLFSSFALIHTGEVGIL